MKYFNLKFTPENLKRHLDYNKDKIGTIRDEQKGEPLDLVIIDGVTYRLDGVLIGNLDLFTSKGLPFYEMGGFKDRFEYISEIIRIYGDDPEKILYYHVLSRVNID